jgi:xanthine dehydrogenase YagT iron-sulfur-binding subunit
VGMMAEGHAGHDPERVREAMSGNICRCGAYAGITEAILQAQAKMAAANVEQAA